MQAIEDHSAYSTHYCSQEQWSDNEEEDDPISVAELQDSLKVSMRSSRLLTYMVYGSLVGHIVTE